MNKLPQYFCVQNDGSDLFKNTVIKYLNSFNVNYLGFKGNVAGNYYGRDATGISWHTKIGDFHIGNIDQVIPLLTIEEFIEMSKEITIEEEFVLPTNWHIIVTEENQKVVSQWRYDDIRAIDGVDIGDIAGCCNKNGKKGHNSLKEITGISYDFGIEITYDQFKKYVLKNAKKIIGYMLLKPEYEDAAMTIGYGSPRHMLEGTADYTVTNDNYAIINSAFTITSPDNDFVKSLKDAGVLDIWFEPIYEDNCKVGDWVYITGKTITGVCVCGNGLPYDGSHDGVFQLMDIDENKYPSGHLIKDSQFMFQDGSDFYRTSKDNILRRATEDEIIEAMHSDIMNQIRKKFPIGTKFYHAHVANNFCYSIVTNDKFKIAVESDDKNKIDAIYALTDEGEEWSRDSKYGNSPLQRTVYYKGKFANVCAVPLIKIKGYTAKFDENGVSFGCQTYSKEFIIKLSKCIETNSFFFECRNEVKKMADWFEKK